MLEGDGLQSCWGGAQIVAERFKSKVGSMQKSFAYVIVGAGLAGAAAVEGIRERDKQGSILLIGREKDLPYDRPPLSKQLWTGGKKVEEIVLHDEEFYKSNGVEMRLGVEVTGIDAAGHAVRDGEGNTYTYGKLLLATGGTPRRLAIPGGDLEGISYYRTLEDYRRLHGQAGAGKSALVIGGGFIGSEMAASLCANKVAVTMVFPSAWLVSRVFPESLGRFLTQQYRAKGVEVVTGDEPVSIAREGSGYVTRTRGGREIRTEMIVAGVGITPNISLAQAAGLSTGNGVVVNERLETSARDIYAAGDIALFPEAGFGPRRLEHWDNAVNQGKHAGKNMAGAGEAYKYLPFFFSDLFEFGYEAVGDVESRLRTFADWQEENKTGVIYYLDGERVRGAMMCNVWGQVDAARALIEKGERVTPEKLRGAIHG
jgi:3-phenylpropionate/trans-cinnamate dioxygenase ferredoxin reductase component